MSSDACMLKKCLHVSGTYIISNCPVCTGTGFYFDLVIDNTGSPIKMTGINKTVQGLTHLLCTEEGSFADYLYPEYGSQTLQLIGSKNLPEIRLKYKVVQDVQYYTTIKQNQQFNYGNITQDEVIQRIISIDATQDAVSQAVGLSLSVGPDNKTQFFSFSFNT